MYESLLANWSNVEWKKKFSYEISFLGASLLYNSLTHSLYHINSFETSYVSKKNSRTFLCDIKAAIIQRKICIFNINRHSYTIYIFKCKNFPIFSLFFLYNCMPWLIFARLVLAKSTKNFFMIP